MTKKDEKKLQDKILLEYGAHDDIRLWRVNVGVAYGMSQVDRLFEQSNRLVNYVCSGARELAIKTAAKVTEAAENMHPTKYGIKGTADINGIVSYQRPDGTYFARFIGIEVKVKPRKATPEQLKWGAMVEKRGGIWILAYSIDDVKNRLRKEGFSV